MSSLSRREFLCAVPAASLSAQKQSTERRPNVVIILTDDQGWGDLSVHGNTNLSTPNIDSLARDGALFERFLVCSVCAPTRAEFLTGRYHPRGGVRGVSTGQERLNVDERTIADVFKTAGYATGAFGKWHNGSQAPYHPNHRGFDEYYGFTSGHWGQYFSPELDHNGELTRGRKFLVDELTDRAIAFMEQNRAKPFFCYLPLNTPHSPMHVPDRFYKKFAGFEPKLTARNATEEDILMTRAALAMCENIDWNVGRVLEALERMKLAEDTVVLYFSDNGPNSWRWNGGMRGRKGSLDEGGLRVPALIRWKGHIPPGKRIDRIAGAIDLLPTFADLADIRWKAPKPLDGRSLKPLLLDENASWPDRMIFTMHNRRTSVRTQHYRLDAEGQLFDMNADPLQDRNIAAEKPEAAAKLTAARDAWTQKMLASTGDGDRRPYTVGYSELTLLPARDGVPHGKIRRSSRHPNCSFFTNWTSTEDFMTWDIEAGTAAAYEAVVYYTCPASGVGSVIELSMGTEKIQAKIAEAHDPPLEGEKEDRAPRTESYVKEFKPLRLGSIRIGRTRGLLTLRAAAVPANQVADVRYVALRRIRG